jgi:hypothetical protein
MCPGYHWSDMPGFYPVQAGKACEVPCRGGGRSAYLPDVRVGGTENSMTKLPLIEIDFQVFVSDGDDEVGAVRYVAPDGKPEIVIYVENAGEFAVPLSAVAAVHSQKVILDCKRLTATLRKAIGHAHDAEN